MTTDNRRPRALISGEAVIWPAGLEKRYGISHVTRWRWERSGDLPPRDIQIGKRSGWRPETIASFESASRPAA